MISFFRLFELSMDLIGISSAILSALCMGTVGVFSKITGLGAEVVTFFRLGLGALFMLSVLLITRQAKYLHRWPSWPVLINGIMLAGFIIFYIQAMQFTTMANAIMLIYLAPPVAAVFAHFFLHERLSPKSVLFIAMALFGFGLMMEFHLDLRSARPMQGIGFGLLSTLCYAAFILINRTIPSRVHAYTRTFFQLLVGALVMLPLCLWNPPELPPRLWPWLAAIGLIPGFIAIFCAVFALSRLPAAQFGTLAYFEPLSVVVFGWVFFAEKLSWIQLSGCLVILLSGVGMTCSASPHPPPVTPPEPSTHPEC